MKGYGRKMLIIRFSIPVSQCANFVSATVYARTYLFRFHDSRQAEAESFILCRTVLCHSNSRVPNDSIP